MDAGRQAYRFYFGARCLCRFQSRLYHLTGRRSAGSVANVAGGRRILFAGWREFAYVPNVKWQRAWKRYHGGQTTPVYIVRLSDLQLQKVPRENSNDSNPVWVGDTVYFLSDRNGPVTIFAYDTKSKQVKQV